MSRTLLLVSTGHNVTVVGGDGVTVTTMLMFVVVTVAPG
jgi:hypothetical protein